MNSESNNNNHDSRILHELMQDSNHELPPTELDAIILQQAKNSNQSSKPKRDWKPWMAAASVVLVIPFIWMLSQNPELSQTNIKMETESVSKSEAGESAPMESTYDVQADEMAPAPVINSAQQPAAAKPSPENFQNMIEEQGKLSITGQDMDRSTIETKRKILMDELKAGKRTIKPSTMSPLMALEYEQFGRYIDRAQFELADQLLTEMQDSYPEFDFEDMIYKLALAEAKHTENQ